MENKKNGKRKNKYITGSTSRKKKRQANLAGKRKQTVRRKNAANDLSVDTVLLKKLRRKAAPFLDWLVLVCLVLFFVWVFLNFGSHRVSGYSMHPTLTNKDRVVIYKTQTPKRYDIITFEPESTPEDNFIKRVVGMPGDSFYVKEKRLYLFPAGKEFANLSDLIYSENLPDSTITFYLTEEVANELEGAGEIPKDTYFVVGDNRRKSTDSRTFSFIKKESIEGVLLFRLYPLSQFGIVH